VVCSAFCAVAGEWFAIGVIFGSNYAPERRRDLRGDSLARGVYHGKHRKLFGSPDLIKTGFDWILG
jgi:hypothetical protein